MSPPTRLPARPAVGTTAATVTLPPSGDLTLSGRAGQRIKVVMTAGAPVTACRLLLSNLSLCEVDSTAVVWDNPWNAVKVTGGVNDCVIRLGSIVRCQSVGVLGVGVNLRNWMIFGKLGPCGEGDTVSPPEQKHGSYFGSQGEWSDGVIANGAVGPQKYGYGIQLYETAKRNIITGFTIETPGFPGARSDVGLGVLVGGSSLENLLVNTVGINCRAGLAGAGAGAQPGALTVRNCGQVGGGSWADGQPGGVVGTWARLASAGELVNDPAFVVAEGAPPPPPPPAAEPDPTAAQKAIDAIRASNPKIAAAIQETLNYAKSLR